MINTAISILLGERSLGLVMVKAYFRSFRSAKDRQLRIAFRGRRLIVKQYKWKYDHSHPWEVV